MLASQVFLRCSTQRTICVLPPLFQSWSRSIFSMTSTNNSNAGVGRFGLCNPSVARPILLVLDFDGTLTMRDTMHLVAEAGYAHQKASNAVPQPTPWSEIVDAYMTDFKSHANSYKQQASKRTTVEQESAWLSSLEEIEEASIQRACDAGIFDNVTRIEMEEAGRRAVRDGQLRLRSGWHKLLTSVHEHNAKVSQSSLPCRVLSVNWSSTFIQGVIRQASEEQEEIKLPTLDQHVYANEIPSILSEDTSDRKDTSPTTRPYIPIRTSDAKAKLLRSFRKDECDQNDALLVYVGDSSTDLDCLLEADLGFCVQDEPMGSGQKDLAETCQRIGVGILPSMQLEGQSSTKSKTLLSVKDFSEIIDRLARNDVI